MEVAAELRRLHIVYFLSRKGRIEHPHLIRLHHLSRNGVRLRDVKRWLGELRGKDMPESFSWSYKRRYKTGYVWQDLMDDDLITPISDNEYVLKGSEISSARIIKDTDFCYTDEEVPKQKSPSSLQKDKKTTCKEENQSYKSEASVSVVSTKSSSEIEEVSATFGSETSTLTDDSGRVEMDKSSEISTKHEKQKPSFNENKADHSSPIYSSVKTEKDKKRSSKVTINENISSTPPSEPKRKSHSNGASNILRNLITCGTVHTNDTAVLASNKQSRPFLNICSSDPRNVHSAEICKRDRLGGSQRVFGTPNWTLQQWNRRKSFDGVKDLAMNKSDLRDQRPLCAAAYKPVNGPSCLQCGKPFKPEKLHSHMKSCKGMKATSKVTDKSAAAKKASKASMAFSKRNSISGHFLTDC